MKNISIRLEDEIVREIDGSLKELNLKNRTEFFRKAINENIGRLELKRLQGSAKELTKEQKDKIKKELKGKDPSYILRKFGID